MKTVKGARGAIWTSTWFTKLPQGFQRVGISLWKPRGFKGEHWSIPQLAPGRWYNSVHPKQYLDLYSDILKALNPQDVADALFAIGPNPVMCCYEKVVDVQAGTKFCHRHIAAKWLADSLNLTIQEIDAPENFYPFRVFDRLAIKVPAWPPYVPINILAGG